jgi:hypothetical protein
MQVIDLPLVCMRQSGTKMLVSSKTEFLGVEEDYGPLEGVSDQCFIENEVQFSQVTSSTQHSTHSHTDISFVVPDVDEKSSVLREEQS